MDSSTPDKHIRNPMLNRNTNLDNNKKNRHSYAVANFHSHPRYYMYYRFVENTVLPVYMKVPLL